MGMGALREKQLVRWSGRVLRLDGRLPDGHWHLTELSSGLMDKQPENVLWRAHELGELKFISEEEEVVEAKTMDLLNILSEAATVGTAVTVENDEEGGQGVKRLRYVEAIRDQSKAQAFEAISRVWQEIAWPKKRPGYSTVMSWRAKANGKADKVCALRDKHHRKGRRGPRYCAEVVNILREVRDNDYLSRNPRINITKAVEKAQNRIRLINATRPKCDHLPLPKRKAMLSVIREIDAVEVIAKRFGADIALQRMRTSLGGVKTSRPLERVEVDHTVLNIFLLDEDFSPVGRAFTTMAKDGYSRACVGGYWGAENPSIVSLARCMRLAVQPKVAFLEKYPDVINTWECFGVAEQWVIDNGLEEHAGALKQATSQMGSQVLEFCSCRTPWEKPHIERFMRQMTQDLLHQLPGAVVEDLKARTDYDPKKDLLLRKSTFDRIMVKWIVDIYMQKPQAVLKDRSPTQVWKDAAGTFHQFVPTNTTLLERLFFRTVEDRLLDHEGVEFDCLIYNSLDMKVLRERLGPRLKVSIQVSDEDLGFIYVIPPGHDVWIKVPCLDQAYSAGLTRWQHGRCKRLRRARADENVEISLAQAWQQISDLIKEEDTVLKHARKKLRARMMERDPSRSLPPNSDDLSDFQAGAPAAGDAETTALDEDTIPDFEVKHLEREVS